MRICALVLAAGGSSRLGRPKQLVQTKGKSLLEHSILKALKAPIQEVYVVLGAHFEPIQASIRHLPVRIIENPQWQEGMGSSISLGMRTMLAQTKADAVLIMLCDQLHIDPQHLEKLVQAYRQHKAPLIVSEYGEQKGVPALFDQKFFPRLAGLSGDQGAKKIIHQNNEVLHSIKCEQALMDIDTPEDLRKHGLA